MNTNRHCLLVAAVPLLIIGCNSGPTPNKGTVSDQTVSSQASPTSPQPAPPASSRWTISKEVNELDGKAKITVSTSDVVFRCAPKFDGYVMPYIPSLGNSLDTNDDHTQTVRFRIDDSPVRKQSWAVSDDFTALFLPTATLKAAIKGKKLVLEFKPSYVARETQTFDFDGLAEAARNAGCKI